MTTETLDNTAARVRPFDGLARALAWGEVFVLLPLHAFWILFTNTPFVAENAPSALVTTTPFAVLLAVGTASQFRSVRAVLVQLERLLHLTAAVCMAVLLCFVTLRDPFNPALPITWPLCFWSVSATFALLANLALHERTTTQATTPRLRATATGVVAWALIAWVATDAPWATYFWTASLLFHSVLAWPTDPKPFGAPQRRLASTTGFIEGLFLVVLVLSVLVRFALGADLTGTAELRYADLVGLCASPWFLLGASVAVVSQRLRLGAVGHTLATALLVLRWPTTPQAGPLLIGYALPSLYLAIAHQGALAYAVSATATTAVWVFGLALYHMAGFVIVLKMGLPVAEGLESKLPFVGAALCGVYLVSMAASTFLVIKKSQETPRLHVGPASLWAYGLVCVLVLAPVIAFAMRTMGHVRLERPPRVAVGEPAGICHAGYSRSDEEYALLGALGARYTRVPFAWASVQPAADTWDFEDAEGFIEVAEQHGVKVIVALGFDNNAIEQSPDGASRGVYVAPEDIPLFLEYARRMATHFEGRVYAWEIWNEPDLPHFWGGTMPEFIELAGQAANAIRGADPDARIVGTAVSAIIGAYSSSGIEGLHAAGALDKVDHPSMHTYIGDPRAYYNEFLRVRNAAAKYGHPGPIWITEVGDPDGGFYPWRASSERLAEHVVKAYGIATAMGFETVMWHCIKDAPLDTKRENPLDSEPFFGLVDHDDRWKPAAQSYALFANHCAHSVIRTDRLRVSGGVGARQLRTVLYERENNECVLLLWFEPALRRAGSARVAVDLGRLDEPALIHDIASDYAKPLLDDVIDVDEKPLFITFHAPGPTTPLRLHVQSSPADLAWLLLAAMAPLCAALARRKA